MKNEKGRNVKKKTNKDEKGLKGHEGRKRTEKDGK